MSHVIAYGNLCDGFTFVGPFENARIALDYAQSDGTQGIDWHLFALTPPDAEFLEELTCPKPTSPNA